jgi:hypothetical protein
MGQGWLKQARNNKKTGRYAGFFVSPLAVPTGFEPAISALTGPHVWPLHHGTRRTEFTMNDYRRQDSCETLITGNIDSRKP